jgi:hypothetical protein
LPYPDRAGQRISPKPPRSFDLTRQDLPCPCASAGPPCHPATPRIVRTCAGVCLMPAAPPASGYPLLGSPSVV